MSVIDFPAKMRAADTERQGDAITITKNNTLAKLAAAAQALCLAREEFEKYKGSLANQYNLNPSIFTSEDLTTWLAAHHVAKYPPIS